LQLPLTSNFPFDVFYAAQIALCCEVSNLSFPNDHSSASYFLNLTISKFTDEVQVIFITGGKTMFFNYRDLSNYLCRMRFFGNFVSLALLVSVLTITSPAQTTSATVNDGHGKEWLQLTASRGLSWNQVAQSCSQDGVTPCTGSFNDWTWATDTQVLQLMSYYEPAMATSRGVGGMQYFETAQGFLSAFQPTFSFCGTYQCGAYGAGWTATKDANGLPLFGAVSWDNTNVSIYGGFGVGAAANADETDGFRGVWLWRATGPGVFAYDDAGRVASPNGGLAVANVLANDFIAGVRATTGNVLMTQVSSTHSGVTLDVFDGSVDAAAATPAGVYSLVYRICDIADSANCDNATVTVTVNPFVVDAVNDAGTASPSTGGTAVLNVLANDRLSLTTTATTANVSLSLVSVSPNNGGITLDVNDGSVDVAAGTALGSYALVYQICDRTNLANCDQATVSVTVQNYVIDAVNDYARASSKVAGVAIASVLANDTFNGTRATTATVQISQVSPPIRGIALNLSTGAISVAAKTSSGTYNLVYKICEIAAPTNCDTATATIELSGRGN
jgi:hypothetical protein